MLIGRDDKSNDVITLGKCFSMIVYVRSSRWLTDIFKQLSPRWTTGDLKVGFQIPEKQLQALGFLFSPRRQSAPESSLAG